MKQNQQVTFSNNSEEKDSLGGWAAMRQGSFWSWSERNDDLCNDRIEKIKKKTGESSELIQL